MGIVYHKIRIKETKEGAVVTVYGYGGYGDLTYFFDQDEDDIGAGIADLLDDLGFDVHYEAFEGYEEED